METRKKISDCDANQHPCKVIDFESKYRKQGDESTLCDYIRQCVKAKFTKRRLVKFLDRSFPFVSNIRTYRFKQDILSDIIAGFTVGIMQIPQGKTLFKTLLTLPFANEFIFNSIHAVTL